MRNMTTIFAGILFLLISHASLQARTIIVLMDGTWNEPEFEENGVFPQGDATNVEKLGHLLLSNESQSIHYFRGIGTDGKTFTRVVDGAFGTTAMSLVDDAMQTVSREYDSGDEIVLFGFSRGAATCRILARRIHKEGIRNSIPMIRFMGLWDTVASLGIPVPKLSQLRKDFPDAEERLRIPANVKHVVHLVAIDEDRSLFELTNISVDSSQTTVDELWLAGNHGDVGGGWVKKDPSERQLSDIALAYMIQSAMSSSVSFIHDWKTKVLEPVNGTGEVHQLSRWNPKLILGGVVERKIKSVGSPKPRVHRSVKLKYDSNQSYRPAQLQAGFGEFKVIP